MSQANRLKLKKSRREQVKKKYKHGEIQRSGSEKRGYKVRYWNQKTGSWQATKPAPLVRKVEVKKEKPLTRAEQLKKGMATWDTEKGNQAVGSPKWDEKGNKKEEKKVVKKEEKKVVVQNKKEDKQGNKEKVEKVEKVAKTENKEKLKVPRYVRNKKTKTLVSTKTNKGKQILKLEERKRKLREKRFGKK